MKSKLTNYFFYKKCYLIVTSETFISDIYSSHTVKFHAVTFTTTKKKKLVSTFAFPFITGAWLALNIDLDFYCGFDIELYHNSPHYRA